MAFTLIIPGRRTPYNCNSAVKAIARYKASPVGTIIRKNQSGKSLKKAI